MSEPESNDVSSGKSRAVWLPWTLILLGLAASFAHNFMEMWARWFPAWRRTHLSLYDRMVEGESYYTHGPIIPVLSLLIFILLIRHVRSPLRCSRKTGSLVLGFGMLFHLVACLARISFASGFAFIIVVAGLVLVLWGMRALRELWFPVAILVFMVPFPEVTISQLNFRLKMIAADWGVTLANVLGVIVERTGNRVFLEGDKILVIANVCNGLRTLISLLAFGALYTYVCRLRGWWRLCLFPIPTVVVAVVANSLRIVSLILVADIWDVEAATGWYHDLSGVLIFVLAFLLMFGIERFVLWLREAVGRPATILPLFHGRLRGPEDKEQWGRMIREVGTVKGYVAGVLLLLVAGGAWWLNQTLPPSLTPDMVARVLPATLTVKGRQLQSRGRELSERTLTILESPSYFYRRYESRTEPPIDVCIIFSKDNRKGTHPPDLCLAGSGEAIIEKADIDVTDREGLRSMPCKELTVQQGLQRYQFTYTYKCGERYTRSFWLQQLTIFTNGLLHRNASGALVRVSTPVAGDPAAARERSVDMLRTMLPYLDRSLP